MKNINDEFNKIIQDLDDNIQNPEDLVYAKEHLGKIASLFSSKIEKIEKQYDDKISKIEAKQKELEETIESLEEGLDEVAEDFYSKVYNNDDEPIEIEINCPYCNTNFIAEFDEDLKDEVQCPECKNVIDIDWNVECEDDDCNCCSHHCHDDEDSEENFDDEDM